MTSNSYVRVYVNFLKKFLKPEAPVKVIFDCSNGTTGRILRQLITNNKKLKTTFINEKPDGNFPAHGPSPLARGATRQLKETVVKEKADLGVVFDADGDRAVFVDDKGKEIDPILIFLLLSPKFRPPYLVSTSAGKAVIDWLKQGLKVIETESGHYAVKKMMLRHRAEFAIEHASHYYFKDFYHADSGILAAVFVLNEVSRLKKRGISLSEWRRELPNYYRIREKTFRVKDKTRTLARVEKFYQGRGRISKLDDISVTGKDFWLNLRRAETEPGLRLNLAAKTKEALSREKRNLVRLGFN
ncbi:MAG: hypothetical protein HYS89_01265 [Candidatus Colwellbacteria bacterium]|nr:hypothetical protein [Candidatus Colwellbacteria bacterium]